MISSDRPVGSTGIDVFRLASEFGLRITGAALHVLATWAILHALEPETAGIYFEGFVLAYALSALLRGKYELYLAHYVTSESAAAQGIALWTLLGALARRTLIRGAIASAALLVLTADLDIQEPQLRPYLETFLPFMLAIPFTTLALLFAGLLRAANRTLDAILISAYALNLTLISAALLAPEADSLLVLSWSFCGGSLLAAVIGFGIARRVFCRDGGVPAPKAIVWRDIYAKVSTHGLTGVALAGLQWGPLCVLALLAPAVQVADFAAAARTAQVVEIMLPVMFFVPCGAHFQPFTFLRLRGEFPRLLANLGVALAATSTWVATLLIGASWLLSFYGAPYAELTGLLTLLLCMQWVNGSTRPAIRYLTLHWPPSRIRNALIGSAVAANVISLIGARQYGADAAAVASLVGALVIGGQCAVAALRISGTHAIIA